MTVWRSSLPLKVGALLVGLAGGVLGSAACRGGAGQAPASGAALRPDAAADAKRPLPQPLPEIAARVNGEPIYMSYVKTFAEASITKNKTEAAAAPGVYREVMNQFVTRELLFQEAVRRGIAADRTALEAAENKARAAYRTEDEWRKALEEQKMDIAAFRAELRVQETVSALMAQENERSQSAPVTSDEVIAYYAAHAQEWTVPSRVQARQIVVRVPPETAADRRSEFRTRAESLLGRARTGADFEKLARAESDDRETKGTGGKLEPFGRGELGTGLIAVEDAALKLSPGQISDVIDTPSAFYIVKVEKLLPGGPRPLDDVDPEIRVRIKQHRRNERLQKLLNELRAKARIETFI